jgi:hypothetical protein
MSMIWEPSPVFLWAGFTVSAIGIVAGGIAEGHVTHGVALAGLLGGGAFHWWRLRRSIGSAADPIAWMLFLFALFGVAMPRIDVAVAWLSG